MRWVVLTLRLVRSERRRTLLQPGLLGGESGGGSGLGLALLEEALLDLVGALEGVQRAAAGLLGPGGEGEQGGGTKQCKRRLHLEQATPSGRPSFFQDPGRLGFL